MLDDDDFERHSRYRWFYRSERNGNPGYAARHGKKPADRTSTVYLHREIMPAVPGREVIFLNHDRLDCRKANLRSVTIEEARQHHRVRKDCTTGAKGVIYNEETDKWSAYIYRGGHAHHIGTYDTREEAADRYQQTLLRENPELHSAPECVERTPMVPRQRGRGGRRSAQAA